MRPLPWTTIVLFGLVPISFAQSSSSSANSSSGSASGGQPDSPKNGAACARSTSGTKGKATQTADDADKKKPKKVWTNEEMGSVKGDVSVVGEPENSISMDEPAPEPSTPAYNHLVQTYRNRLAPLRNEVADLDRKIQQAKEAKGNAREDTAAWIAVQQKKRGDILAKIERIQEEARKRGVEPGDLRD